MWKPQHLIVKQFLSSSQSVFKGKKETNWSSKKVRNMLKFPESSKWWLVPSLTSHKEQDCRHHCSRSRVASAMSWTPPSTETCPPQGQPVLLQHHPPREVTLPRVQPEPPTWQTVTAATCRDACKPPHRLWFCHLYGSPSSSCMRLLLDPPSLSLQA